MQTLRGRVWEDWDHNPSFRDTEIHSLPGPPGYWNDLTYNVFLGKLHPRHDQTIAVHSAQQLTFLHCHDDIHNKLTTGRICISILIAQTLYGF